MMKEQIVNYLNRYVSFSLEETDLFYENLTERDYEKKDFLIRQGDTSRYYYFIIKGLVRSFHLDANGKERITQFAIENWWITNLESFIRETPSEISIQALEYTQVLALRKEKLEKLYLDIPKLERFFRILTQNMLIAIQRRNEYYLRMDSKKLYESLIKNLPDFTQRVPQYMIASYLEITPEYLSELRRQK